MERKRLISIVSIFILIFLASSAFAEDPTLLQTHPTLHGVKINGPRVGFTMFAGQELLDSLDANDIGNGIFQFGWHFEWQSVSDNGRGAFLFAVVPLIGGLEYGSVLPSLSALMGLRHVSGFEAGIGPNFSATGTAVVGAVGKYFMWNGLPIHSNIAIAHSEEGERFTLTVGFGMFHSLGTPPPKKKVKVDK
ncbi:hypothetical protein K8I28_14475 [bacterium]|nr:hypothetical protein [bacterium]